MTSIYPHKKTESRLFIKARFRREPLSLQGDGGGEGEVGGVSDAECDLFDAFFVGQFPDLAGDGVLDQHPGDGEIAVRRVARFDSDA